ncbi:hypothetical protein D4764_08G0003220 [Takifugu flavidus]|uniref:Uncharacterized protein n=1 Tax=Takifugu flavidus TaxID=433684 RepID=A0A5C6MNM3_9TELE|nr:hypothetical protein D4764_08G0003220 [Takifugu flavidus]
MAHQYVPLQEGLLCLPAQSQEHGGDSRRQVVTPVELDGAVEDHQNWQLCHWHPVLFTEESRFNLSTCDRRERVWRCCGERYAACNIIQHDRFGGGSVMVWGGISLEGRTDLYRLDNEPTLVQWDLGSSWSTTMPDLMSILRHQVNPQTVQELSDALVQIWEEIPQDTIRCLIRSESRRCQA